MREHLERELKLDPGEGFVMPELGGQLLAPRTFVSTYHDTPDLVLARHGVTFRHRVEDGAGLWQLKLPRGDARAELELPGPPARPPEEMLALLPALLRDSAVVPVARLRTRREGVRAQGAEITRDSVAVLEGTRVARRFHELEVELLDGDERTLRRLEKELRRAGAHLADPDQRPKLYRALDLATPSEPLVVEPGTPPVVALGLALGEQRHRLVIHDPGTRLGSDPEDLHQLRVATRRLRAFLRAGRVLLDRAWADGLREELRWLGTGLGPARDLDVLIERIAGDVALLGPEADLGAGLLVQLEAERALSRAAVADALTSERYFALLDALETAGSVPQVSGEIVPLASIWEREWKRVRREVGSLPDEPADEELHAIRIGVKRARYAAELAAHELGRKGGAFVQAAKAAQDVLGEHQDAAVAEERIRAWAATASGGALAAGRLVQLEQARRAAMRLAWPAAWSDLHAAARRLR